MPELPEVETVKRILEPIIQGETIRSIDIYREKNVLNAKETFLHSLVGETFLGISRRGKYLIFHLTHAKAIISHLRMEGKYYEGKADEPKQKHDILRYVFASNKTLRYNDVRTFGTIEFRNEKDLYDKPPLSRLGKEPFDISPDELFETLQKKNCPIKEAIMDQSIIAGIGNIYADEILFTSSVHPLTKANSLTKENVKSIIDSSIHVLSLAIEQGGSTIRSYHPKEGVSGNMQNELSVYGKKGKPCPRCSFPLRKIIVGGRGTTYCPNCQKGNQPIVIGVTGPIASGKSEVARYLSSKGYLHLDADKIVASLYRKPNVLKRIQSIFGAEAVKDDTLDRAYLREQINESSEKKEKLERFIWPLVYRTMEREISKAKCHRILLDVPFLIDSPLEKECDAVIYIEANASKQTERIKARGKDPISSLKMNASFPREKAKNRANIILDGNGSKEELQKQIGHYSFL